jgi:hypothetical protein
VKESKGEALWINSDFELQSCFSRVLDFVLGFGNKENSKKITGNCIWLAAQRIELRTEGFVQPRSEKIWNGEQSNSSENLLDLVWILCSRAAKNYGIGEQRNSRGLGFV